MWIPTDGLWGAECTADGLPADSSLDELLEGWLQHACDSQHPYGGRESVCAEWLFHRPPDGPTLTVGLPAPVASIGPPRQAGMHDERLVWWPAGVPGRRRIAILSSRIRNRHRVLTDWLAAFRASIVRIDRRSDLLLTARGTTVHPWVLRAAALFALPILEVILPRAGAKFPHWRATLDPTTQDRTAQDTDSATTSDKPVKRLIASVSPPREPGSSEDSTPAVAQQRRPVPPLRDRYLLDWAERVLVLHVRSGGHVEKLIRDRARRDGSVIELVASPNLIPPALFEELVSLGCRPFSAPLPLPLPLPLPPSAPPATVRRPLPSGLRVNLPARDSWDFLTHCTRQPSGAWPDESQSQYLDSLICDLRSRPRTALDALLRISTGRRIVASAAGIRGRTPVVCWTEAHPSELSEMRIYRRHRRRWDFEPYGVCVRKSWLQAEGARPVLYGDSRAWETLGQEDRPFFQARGSGDPAGPRIDWTREREWRHVGDVDLTRCGADDAFFFVPDQADAAALLEAGVWPVAVIDSTGVT